MYRWQKYEWQDLSSGGGDSAGPVAITALEGVGRTDSVWIKGIGG
jgi:hypothetical protein